MRGTVAKRIRKEVYGDLSIYARKYYVASNGSYHADEHRKTYQLLKKAYIQKNKKQKEIENKISKV